MSVCLKYIISQICFTKLSLPSLYIQLRTLRLPDWSRTVKGRTSPRHWWSESAAQLPEYSSSVPHLPSLHHKPPSQQSSQRLTRSHPSANHKVAGHLVLMIHVNKLVSPHLLVIFPRDRTGGGLLLSYLQPITTLESQIKHKPLCHVLLSGGLIYQRCVHKKDSFNLACASFPAGWYLSI